MGASGLDATAAATSHGPIQRPQRHRGHAGRASSAPSAGTGSRSCPGPCPARHRPGLSPRGGGPHPAGRGNRRPGHRPATPTLDEVVLHLTGRPAASETLTAATSGTVPPHDHPPGYRRPRRPASAVSTGRSPLDCGPPRRHPPDRAALAHRLAAALPDRSDQSPSVRFCE